MPADIEDGFSESGRAERDRSELKRLHPCNELADGAQQVPGTAAVWVKTFGCAHNVSDSEFMLGQLQAQGYRHAQSCSDCKIAPAAASRQFRVSLYASQLVCRETFLEDIALLWKSL